MLTNLYWDKSPTVAHGVSHVVGQSREVPEAFGAVHVGVGRVAGDPSQLVRVRLVSDSHSHQVDILPAQFHRLLPGGVRVVRLAVCDDDGNIWGVEHITWQVNTKYSILL